VAVNNVSVFLYEGDSRARQLAQQQTINPEEQKYYGSANVVT
jgi:hypothetical protein